MFSKKKHDARYTSNQANPYKTSFDNYDPSKGDPSPENIHYKGEACTIYLNYDGSPSTKQPGNVYLKRINYEKQLSYHKADKIKLDMPGVELLLLIEISRRHAIDTCRRNNNGPLNGSDEFCDLPVGLGLAMANELISAGKIDLSDFWTKNKMYHLYSGEKDQREEAFKKLYEKFQECEMRDLSDTEKKIRLLGLLESYFEVEHIEKSEPSNKAIRELNRYNYHGNPSNVHFSTSRVRAKPRMGQSDLCYNCGRSGHWSKECPAQRNGGRSAGLRGPGRFGTTLFYGRSLRYRGSSVYGGQFARGPRLRGPPRRMNPPVHFGPGKMSSRRDFYEGGSADRYRDSYDDYGRSGYGEVGGYPYEPIDSSNSDYPSGGYGGSSFSDYPPVSRGRW
ncbi:uncharacterized protein LOC136031807 isoform X2 [Artemia franciscana]|uniref:uncharacterized protein LOC136031807 isoform X2 n=1 Tax=Artemia franciscana TaxID=6661 RepID=UPI0032DB8F3D